MLTNVSHQIFKQALYMNIYFYFKFSANIYDIYIYISYRYDIYIIPCSCQYNNNNALSPNRLCWVQISIFN